jgi:hypothetical protein
MALLIMSLVEEGFRGFAPSAALLEDLGLCGLRPVSLTVLAHCVNEILVMRPVLRG